MPTEQEHPITRAAMRAELEAIETHLIDAIRQNGQQLKTEILATTQEFVRDARTEILRGFHAFAVSQDARLAKIQADLKTVDAATDTRIHVLEQRLMAIEAKLLLNPPRLQ